MDAPLLEVLREGVFAELGLAATPWTQDDLWSPGLSGRPPFVLRGDLTPNAAGEVAPVGYRHPVVEQAEMTITGSSLDADGTYHATGQPLYRFGLAEGSSLHITSASVRTPTGVKVDLSDPTVIKASETPTPTVVPNPQT